MRILLVDDEPYIMEYITQCIVKSNYDCQVVGQLRRAADVLDFLRRNPVDLILADITMPQMNGLELLEAVKQQYPQVDVVMLTSHRKFEYVREAMQGKASDYIIKVELNPESVNDLLEKAEARMKKNSAIDKMVVNMEQANYLRRVLSDDRIDLLDADSRYSKGIFIEDFDFVALAFPYNRELFQILSNYQDLWMKNQLIFVSKYSQNENNRVFFVANIVFQGTSRANYWQLIDTLVSKLGAACNGTVGISKIYYHASRLKIAMQEASRKMDELFYGFSDTQSLVLGKTQRQMKLDLQIMANDAVLAYYEGRNTAYRKHAHEIIDYAKNHYLIEVGYLRQILSFLIHVLGDKHISSQVPEYIQSIESAQNIVVLQEVMENFHQDIERAGKRYSDAVRKSLDYLNLNFTRNVTLREVADAVYLNKEYLSRRFKAEMTVNLSEYVTNRQMMEACRMLNTTNLKVQEIAQNLGITSISYFSSAFKKRFGVSPSDLRKIKD